MSSHQVEAILDRKVYSGKVLYLAKWAGFPIQEASWEPTKTLQNYRHLIKQFQEKQKQNISMAQIHTQDEEPKSNNAEFNSIGGSIREGEIDYQGQLIEKSEPLKKRKEEKEKEKTDRSVPQVFKKRGRPKKNESTLQNLPSITSEVSSQINKAQSEMLVQRQPPLIKREDNVRQKMIQKNNELLRIYYCERTNDGKVEYIIEEKEKKLRKCRTNELIHLYSRQLVDFLENALLSKRDKYPDYT